MDGEEALAALFANQFDIVSPDVRMPKRNAFETCARTRKKSTGPIILVTACGEDHERIIGLDSGLMRF